MDYPPNFGSKERALLVGARDLIEHLALFDVDTEEECNEWIDFCDQRIHEIDSE